MPHHTRMNWIGVDITTSSNLHLPKTGSGNQGEKDQKRYAGSIPHIQSMLKPMLDKFSWNCWIPPSPLATYSGQS